jgi:hypothetical protein
MRLVIVWTMCCERRPHLRLGCLVGLAVEIRSLLRLAEVLVQVAELVDDAGDDHCEHEDDQFGSHLASTSSWPGCC